MQTISNISKYIIAIILTLSIIGLVVVKIISSTIILTHDLGSCIISDYIGFFSVVE